MTGGDPRTGVTGAPPHDDEKSALTRSSPETTSRRSRRSALKSSKRRRRAGFTVAALGAAVVIAIGLVWADRELGGSRRRAATAAGQLEAFPPPTDVTLLFGTAGDGEPRRVRWITLLMLDVSQERGRVLYVPAHTATEVPGRGLLPLADAFTSGGAGLLRVSTENLLGIQVDRSVEITDEAARSVFESIEPLTVEVPVEVRVREGESVARVVLSAGGQELSADRIVDLLYLVGLGGDDAELGSRHLAFWQAYMESAAATRLAQALDDADLTVDEEVREDLDDALAALAELPAGQRDVVVLPVEQAGASNQLFTLDTPAARALLGADVGGVPSGEASARVQVLNGNGEPGVGAEAGERLVEGGFRVVLSGNARRLDYRKTLVIAYEESPEAIELAQRARDLLGVGEVQVSAQPQGIVDLTIVLGKDYLRR